jgi:hypothetical protein
MRWPDLAEFGVQCLSEVNPTFQKRQLVFRIDNPERFQQHLGHGGVSRLRLLGFDVAALERPLRQLWAEDYVHTVNYRLMPRTGHPTITTTEIKTLFPAFDSERHITEVEPEDITRWPWRSMDGELYQALQRQHAHPDQSVGQYWRVIGKDVPVNLAEVVWSAPAMARLYRVRQPATPPYSELVNVWVDPEEPRLLYPQDKIERVNLPHSLPVGFTTAGALVVLRDARFLISPFDYPNFGGEHGAVWQRETFPAWVESLQLGHQLSQTFERVDVREETLRQWAQAEPEGFQQLGRQVSRFRKIDPLQRFAKEPLFGREPETLLSGLTPDPSCLNHFTRAYDLPPFETMPNPYRSPMEYALTLEDKLDAFADFKLTLFSETMDQAGPPPESADTDQAASFTKSFRY